MNRRIELFKHRPTGKIHAWCTVCAGSGKTEHSDGTGDPERDHVVRCDVCGGQGTWRVTAFDPMEQLKSRRILACKYGGPYAARYGELLQTIVSPLNRELP